MIKTKKGEVELIGSLEVLLTDIEFIVARVKYAAMSEGLTEEDIDKLIIEAVSEGMCDVYELVKVVEVNNIHTLDDMLNFLIRKGSEN
jgi:hypothetical protein